MKITLDVVRVSIITGDGADKIFLTVKVPSPVWPFDAGTASFDVTAAHQQGKTWLDANFPDLSPITEVIGPNSVSEAASRLVSNRRHGGE